MKNIISKMSLVIALLSTSLCMAYYYQEKNQDLDKEFVLDQENTINDDLVAFDGGEWRGVDNSRDGGRYEE